VTLAFVKKNRRFYFFFYYTYRVLATFNRLNIIAAGSGKRNEINKSEGTR